MRSVMGAVLSVICLSGSAWALTPMDPIQDTWTASPMPNGGTSYSNGLDVLEVSPSGPSSASVHGWTNDGRETTSTLSLTPRYDQPRERSWTERMHRTLDIPTPVCRVSCLERR